jgi:soluble lytic murein transglycosylase-like protein
MFGYLAPILLTVWPVVGSTEFKTEGNVDRILDLTHTTLPNTPVLLNRNDAVAYELTIKIRTLSKEDTVLVANTICRLSKKLGYDPFLFIALIRTESNFNHLATSPVGAEGLMQVMPYTAKWMADKLGIEWPDGHSFDPNLNVTLGIHYLVLMDKEFNGQIRHALTAYNRGPGATHYTLRHNGGKLPTEIDEFYSAKVMERYYVFREKYKELELQ